MASGKHTGSYELKSAKIIRGGEAVDITMMVSEMNIFSSIIDRTKYAFQALGELPDYYQYLLFICISAF